MILYSFAHELEERTPPEKWPCDKFRKVIEISKWEEGVAFGLYQQCHFRKSNEWRIVRNFFDVSVTKHFSLGSFHGYYDGPHCGFSIGWVHFNWDGNPWTDRCKKCEEGM